MTVGLPADLPPHIPRGRGVRVVGDVHGDIDGLRAAVATDLFVVQLGDLVDHGPDSAAVLDLMGEVTASWMAEPLRGTW